MCISVLGIRVWKWLYEKWYNVLEMYLSIIFTSVICKKKFLIVLQKDIYKHTPNVTESLVLKLL